MVQITRFLKCAILRKISVVMRKKRLRAADCESPILFYFLLKYLVAVNCDPNLIVCPKETEVLRTDY